MIEMAPIQMFVFGFRDAEQFTPAIMQEVESLQNRGLIRLIDLLYVERLAGGSLVRTETSGLGPDELEEFGDLLEKLLGGSDGAFSPTHDDREHTHPADDELFYGLSRSDMAGIVDDIPPGGAAVLVLFEHTWAFEIRNKIRRATGYPITQGFLAQELFLLIGEEVRLLHDTAIAVQTAREARGAALLEALDSLAGSPAGDNALVTSMVENLQRGPRQTVVHATRTVRALIESGFLTEAAAEDAIRCLIRSELIDSDAVSAAERLIENVNPN